MGEIDRRGGANRPVEVLVELRLRQPAQIVDEIHRPMIFSRWLVMAVTATGLVAVLGAGGPGPGAELAARELVRGRAQTADAALAELETALVPVLDAGRDGAARVVAGDERPGDRLGEAATALRAALPATSDAASAVEALEAARRAHDPDAGGPLQPAATSSELGSIAEQLDAAGAAGDAFVAMRLRAERLTGHLDDALEAMDAGDLGRAREAVETARADHRELAAWEIGLLTLPIWLETTDAMLDAVEAMLAALEAGDADGAAIAGERVTDLAPDAATADRALRIAIAEGGASVPAAPLGRLAAVLGELRDVRTQVASILQSVGR